MKVAGRSSAPWARVVPLFPSAPHTTPQRPFLLMGVEPVCCYTLSPREFAIVPRYPSGVLTIRRTGRLVIYYPHAIGYTQSPVPAKMWVAPRSTDDRDRASNSVFDLPGSVPTRNQILLP